MVFTVQDAYVPIPKFTAIFKVISDCLMLQHTVKRCIFLHACIQTVANPPIFNVVYHLGDLKKDKLNLECI